jgi:hypothetical protein
MKSILVRNLVISLNKFIYAEQINDNVRVYLADLPGPHNYAFIRCKNQADAREVLAYINDQIKLKA